MVGLSPDSNCEFFILKNASRHVVVLYVFNPSQPSGIQHRQISASSGSSWCTEQVLDQPELHSESRYHNSRRCTEEGRAKRGHLCSRFCVLGDRAESRDG